MHVVGRAGWRVEFGGLQVWVTWRWELLAAGCCFRCCCCPLALLPVPAVQQLAAAKAVLPAPSA